jgi:hypothetical protein
MSDERETVRGYRARAERARTIAATMRDPELRVQMLKLADEWDELAERVETIWSELEGLRRLLSSATGE